MDRETSKRKIDLLKSIMSDPKLSKTLTEALKSPIGSTKRDQARSVFSIMKKINNKNPDGQGGLFSQTINYTKDQETTPAKTPDYKLPADYSNMIVFQPTPAFKVPPTVKTGDQFSLPKDLSKLSKEPGKNLLDVSSNGPSSSSSNYSNPNNLDFSNIKVPESNIKEIEPEFITKKVFKPYNGGLSGGYYVEEQVKNPKYRDISSIYPNISSQVNNKTIPESTVNEEQSVDNIENALQDRPAVDNGNTGIVSSASGPTKSTNPTIVDAQNYVDNSTGPLTYAKDRADALYEGGLQAEVQRNDAELKDKLGFTKYETQLNNMEANKGALIPTLTSYIRGRDEYLSSIDQMIENTENSLMQQDMSNPAVADSYNNYLNYLYTLKGRQTQRYGNYLNAAVDEYNTELDRVNSQFNSVKDEFDRLSGQNYEMTVNEYNNTLAAASDLYTSLEEAPTKFKEQQILDNQLTLQALEIMGSIGDVNNTTDPDYMAKLKKYTNDLTDDEGNLNFNNIGPGGLAEAITRVDLEGSAGNKDAFIDALKRVMKQTMDNAEKGGTAANADTVLKMKNLVDDLAKIEGGNIYTEDINPTLNANQNEVVSKYIQQNITTIKDALSDLVDKNGPLGKNIESDEDYQLKAAEWMNNYSSLGKNILNGLYQTVRSSTTDSKDFKGVVNTMLSGSDLQIANKLAKDITNVKN